MDKKELAKFIGNKIRLYRNKMNLTQDQLGEKLDTKKSTISNYETGYRTPQQDDLFEIASVLHISIDDLFPERQKNSNDITTVYNKLEPPRQQKVLTYANEQLEEQQKKQQQEKTKKEEKHSKVSNIEDKCKPKNDLPVQEEYENVKTDTILSAGAGTDTIDGGIDELAIKESDIPNKFDMVASVAGDSMYPQFEDGDIVFVKYQKDIEKGMIAAVEINKEMYIKRVYLEDTRIRLVSLNKDTKENGEPLYPDFFADEVDDIHLVGKVIDKVSVKIL